jgi:hypothetical protein
MVGHEMALVDVGSSWPIKLNPWFNDFYPGLTFQKHNQCSSILIQAEPFYSHTKFNPFHHHHIQQLPPTHTASKKLNSELFSGVFE